MQVDFLIKIVRNCIRNSLVNIPWLRLCFFNNVFVCVLLRRGGSRYTTILVKAFSYFCSRLRRGDLRYTKIFFYSAVSLNFFRASGEAILGTLKYFSIAP